MNKRGKGKGIYKINLLNYIPKNNLCMAIYIYRIIFYINFIIMNYKIVKENELIKFNLILIKISRVCCLLT